MSYNYRNIPDWAKYIATDSDGSIWAFSGLPEIDEIPSEFTESGKDMVWMPVYEDDYYIRIGKTYPDMFWRESMQEVNHEKS